MRKTMKKISIEFSQKEYEMLMHLVYLGNWMVNSHRNDPIEDYESIQHKILQKADCELDKKDMVEYDETFEKMVASEEFEEQLTPYIDEYDHNTFWEELGYELAERDFYRKYNRQRISKMSPRDRLMETEKIASQYFDEFQQNGIQNIVITNTQ
jgi:hypothetical protein